MPRSLMCLLFLAATVSTTSADDAVKIELDEARATYNEQIKSATEKLLAAAESTLKEYAAKGDLDSVKEIKSQKEAFERDGSLPSSRKLSSATSKYETELRAAMAAFQKALENAKTEYTKALKIAEADAASAELAAMTGTTPATADELGGSNDLFQAGSVWTGYRRFPDGNQRTFELHVITRGGKKFTGRAIGNNVNIWEIEGTVEDGRVEWNVTEVRAGTRRGRSHEGTLAGDKLSIQFLLPARGRKGTGELRLSKNAYAESRAPRANTLAPAETERAQKMPETGDFEDFLKSYDARWAEAKRRLVNGINNRQKEIRASNLEGDERLRRRDAIERDLQAFQTAETLPNSDDVLDVVVSVLESHQDAIANLESMRRYWSDKAVRLNDKDAEAKLAALEKRLDKIIGGRQMFTLDSTWAGKRQTEKAALAMRLTVKELKGVSFSGTLSQTYAAGGRDLMAVAGQLDRNKITFSTTEMVRGANRRLIFSGYLLSDRIITSIDGIQRDGRRASGWMSLWRVGAGPGDGQRRRVSSR